jgi:hypothetical protein
MEEFAFLRRTVSNELSGRKHRMAQVTTLELPLSLVSLPEREQMLLLRAGLYEAGRARIRQLEAEMAEAEVEIQRFETRYGMTFAQFETNALSMLDSLEAHDDYNDWFFWQSVLTDRRALLAEIGKATPA